MVDVHRRSFLKVSAAATGGLFIGFSWAGCKPTEVTPESTASFPLNAFLEIDTSGQVTIMAPVPEIGQGVRTSLPMIVAEELDIEWSSVRVLQAEAGSQYGGMTAAGSDSVFDYWEPLRQAGATARALLVAAAAQEWSVEENACYTEKGQVVHRPSGREMPYGSLVEVASTLPKPQAISLKDPEDFDLIGTRVKRVDLADIVNGSAVYGLDVRLPGMLYATVERCPVHGGSVAGFDAGEALLIPGVREVVEVKPLVVRRQRYGAVKSGVAVIADNTWAALQGRKALTVTWNEGSYGRESSARVNEQFQSLKNRRAQTILRNEGNAREAIDQAALRVEAEYELPLLAHVCMEPMNFTADVQADHCELWGPTQTPRMLQAILSIELGLPPESVRVHPTLAGGGFGRRLAYDYGVEAAMISRDIGAPIQVIWTREDDVQHDYYRTPNYHRMRAGIDEKGQLIAWHHHILTSPLNTHIEGPEVDYPELYDVQGGADLPYAIDHILVGYTPIDLGLQLGSWRSVSHSFNVFAVNSFLDEIAAATDTDPYTLQQQLLGEPREIEISLPLPGRRGHPTCDIARLKRVLEVAAEKAAWGHPLPSGWGRGLACCYYKQTYAAHVAEVSVEAGGQVKVQRVVSALDCGLVINPDGVEAQVEGAVMDGVATVLKWGITLDQGRVQQSNFHDYPMLTMGEAPKVEVHIIPSTLPPSGTGEPPYPSVPPAITNAIFAATGTRIRRLPITTSV